MIERKRLLSDLQTLLKRIEADLLQRSEASDLPEVGQRLQAEYERAQAAERTALNYEDWPSGCEACVQLWNLTTVNRQWMNLTMEFDGITETRSRGCNKRQRSV